MHAANRDDIKRKLEEKLGVNKVSDKTEILKSFSSDASIQPGKLPILVITPTTLQEIQDILVIGNEYKISIIPSSSTEKYYGGTIPLDDSIIVDLRQMNKIIEVDEEEKYVRIEAGVTFKQLQTELKKHGLRIMVPLGYPSSASVVSTYMERVPLLSGPKILLSEGWQCILNMQIVIPNGMVVNTGSASWCKDRPSFLPSGPASGPDLSRVFSGAQGTLGIVTDLIIKAKYLPIIKKIIFIPFTDFEDIIDQIYQIQTYDKGREFLGVSQKNLALMVSEDESQISASQTKLPPWLIVMGIEADSEEKFQIDLDDLRDFGVDFKTEFVINGQDLSSLFLKEFEVPEKLNSFRKYKGGCLHIPFYVNLDAIKDFNTMAEKMAENYNYPTSDLFNFFMPIEQVHTCYFDYTIHFNRNNETELAPMKNFFLELSEGIIEKGGVIDRPYGPWAKMIFSRNQAYYEMWRQVKQIVDPNGIMNPGQLII